MMTRLKFFVEAIKNFRQVGTITRSGKAMSRKIGEYIASTDKNILEIGAGDGPLTRQILKQMHPEGRLLCFEINPNLAEDLRKIKDERLLVINDSAENLEKYMAEHDITSFDAIVSAIPFLTLPQKLAIEILSLCKKHLKEGKPFLQVHYAKTKIGLYKDIFGSVKPIRIYRNLPPAYVFVCNTVNGKPNHTSKL